MQEIHALDLEVKRLKEVKAIHKEYRRYVEMPSKSNFQDFTNQFSWCNVPPMPLLQRLEQTQALVQSRVLREAMQKVDGRRANKDAIAASPAANCSCPSLTIAKNILAQAIQRINYSIANQEW